MAKSTNRFFKSVPHEWRIILIGLTLTLFIVTGFQFAIFAASFQRGGDGFPLYLPLVGLVPLAFVVLLKDLTVSDNKYPLGNVVKYLLAGASSLATIATVMSVYFEYAHQSQRDMKAEWAISDLCTADGDVRADNANICAALLPSFKGHICMLGATPLSACEVRLRNQLDLPETGPATL
ncbi:MAG: hypothetical protein ABJG15_04265 [Hyphomonadaceae bacterium]